MPYMITEQYVDYDIYFMYNFKNQENEMPCNY